MISGIAFIWLLNHKFLFLIIIKDIIKNKSFPENLKGILFFPLLVLLPQLGQDVGVALQPVVGEQAVGAVFDAPAHHKTAPAVGHPVEGAVAEETVKFLLPHALVAGEVFTFFVLKPGVVLAGHVHGGFSSQFKLMQTAPAGKPAGAVVDAELLVAADCGGLQDPLVGAVVLDGFPLHLPAEQRHQGDGDVGQHEDV